MDIHSGEQANIESLKAVETDKRDLARDSSLLLLYEYTSNVSLSQLR